MADPDSHIDGGSDEEEGGKGGRSKSRRELPAGAVATLKAWLLSPEHFTHPYPTPQDQVMLMQKTGIDKKQLKNWFTNARRRIWKPMLKKQLEQGKLASTGGGGGGVAVPGVVPGLMVATMPGGIVGQSDQMQYQQSMQSAQPQQEYGSQAYAQQPHMSQPGSHAHVVPSQASQMQYYESPSNAPGAMALSTSIGSLPQIGRSSSGQQLNKTDSHAVLMELFARDQDLVRQATESAGIKGKSPAQQDSVQDQGIAPQSQHQQMSSQHPMKAPSQKPLVSVPTLNSWPHFSSVSSLNNLGTMPGVKSITSMSGADLAKQGPVNTMENLAQVKSVESMGKNDSYAFLEVFFGDRSSVALNSMAKDQKGVKREREEDNDVGLSLEDESPLATNPKRESSGTGEGHTLGPDMNPSPFMSDKDRKDSTGTLKRAYDDALAARGLISVSRSCEKLTDLALPAKIQRTLSQEFIRQQQEQQQSSGNPAHSSSFGQYQYSSSQGEQNQSQSRGSSTASQQYPGQHPGQQQVKSGNNDPRSFPSGKGESNTSVEVPSATKCALCHQTNVDTQLRPCGHMFHERCLKPSLQAPLGPPKCPVDHIPMQSALLAVPTDENAKPLPIPAPMQPQPAAWNPSVGSTQAVSTDPKR
eukprot:CAMPEP_0117017714 /NCGR_PEP_ID=MMETSP0472-20121206/13799_1 /TAXON_ID=693140 ORGANISM="Tiarina fusus, Strain LIS" /NCGR_SAMPLE_ID=MMETSP0472 /ASSEMBLY_ACC=CAM_ASM_000603 /LENGTH=640 /DNA_ID=CAMNT_0004722169 /DNA_START=279 /DNA_END=2201 /DNA_ORIENTATION=-